MGLVPDWAIRLYCRIVKPPGWVKVSGGFFVKVRRLELYELDAVPFDDPGPFKYPYNVNGKTVERIYDISQWPQPPKPPEKPEDLCEEGSYEWALWRVYNLYQSALLQRVRQVEAAEAYAHSIARYILASCIKPTDRRKVATPPDYELVYKAAINPEVSLSDIAKALDETFGASFDGLPILDQIFEGKGGSAKVDAIRQWAGQARQAWGLDKIGWAGMPVKERAEMVVVTKLSSWLETLEWRKRDKNK